jgi:FKBP-type peptidyl-prolyl cis-trans isomerase 2
MHQANIGDRVRIQYCRVPQRGTPQNKASRKTHEFIVGSKEVFPTLSFGVVGMAPGDRKQFTLQPDEAYGAVQSKLIKQIPRQRFPQHIALIVGKQLTAFVAASGLRRRVRIVEIHGESVTVDGNHPLAGKIIQLEVNLISVDRSSNANKRKPQFDLGGRG